MNVKTALLFLLSALSGSYSLLPRKFYYEPKTTLSWTLAQTECRQKYTDLAFVNSKADLDKMSAIYVNNYISSSSWIGGSNLNSDSQNTTQIDSSPQDRIKCPAIDTHSWKETDEKCLNTLPFYCSQDEGKRVFIRLKLKPDRQVDLTDPEIRGNILDEINGKFNKTSLGDVVKIQWTTSLERPVKGKVNITSAIEQNDVCS